MSNLYVRKGSHRTAALRITLLIINSLQALVVWSVSVSFCPSLSVEEEFQLTSHCCFSLLSFAVMCLCSHRIDLKSGRRPVATLDSFLFRSSVADFAAVFSVFDPIWAKLKLLNRRSLIWSYFDIDHIHYWSYSLSDPKSSPLPHRARQLLWGCCWAVSLWSDVSVIVPDVFGLSRCSFAPKPAMFLERKSFAMATVPDQTSSVFVLWWTLAFNMLTEVSLSLSLSQYLWKHIFKM